MASALEEDRWRAMRLRIVNTTFVYAVKSTGIYCLSNCPGRLARRANVAFYDSPMLAERAGFRACKRCRPEHPATAEAADLGEQHAKRRATAKAKAVMDRTAGSLAWKDVAMEVGLTPRYLFEAFKSVQGVTPGVYASTLRANQSSRRSDHDLEIEGPCNAGHDMPRDGLPVLSEWEDAQIFPPMDMNSIDMSHCTLSSDDNTAMNSHCLDPSSSELCYPFSLSAADSASGLVDGAITSGNHVNTVVSEPPSLALGGSDEWSSWIDLDMQPA
nr:bifunctional transcriptional activator/dna repair enzyme ada [Quercus suber]